MAPCYALKQNGLPCRNWAVTDCYTCHLHTDFFNSVDNWFDKILRNDSPTGMFNNWPRNNVIICKHIKDVVSSGILKLEARHIADIKPSDDIFTAVLKYSPHLSASMNPPLIKRAFKTIGLVLRKYMKMLHDGYSNISIYGIQKVIEPVYFNRVHPVIRHNPVEEFFNLLIDNQTMFYDIPASDQRLVFIGLIENWFIANKEHPAMKEWFLDDSALELTNIIDQDNIKNTFFERLVQLVPPAKAEVYSEIKSKCDIYKEELMSVTWHPGRFQEWCLCGNEFKN